MSKKKLLPIALLFTAVAAVSIPFISRAENSWSSSREKSAKLDTSPIARATTASPDDLPQVISLEVTPSGFESGETIAPRGKFLILLQNRTGQRDLNFWLARENEG